MKTFYCFQHPNRKHPGYGNLRDCSTSRKEAEKRRKKIVAAHKKRPIAVVKYRAGGVRVRCLTSRQGCGVQEIRPVKANTNPGWGR